METNKDQIDESEETDYYVLSPELLERMEGGEAIPSEMLNEFRVEKNELSEILMNQNCTAHSSGSITCTCSGPDGRTTTKTGTCTNYYSYRDGGWHFCYTLCQTCVYVCRS